MKLHHIIVLSALAVSPVLAGCKSDAQKVCDHLADLASKASSDDAMGKKMAEELGNVDKCVADVEKMQKEDAKAFDQAKSCILEADKIEGAIGCMFAAAAKKAGADKE